MTRSINDPRADQTAKRQRATASNHPSDTPRRHHQRIPKSRLTSHDRVSGTHRFRLLVAEGWRVYSDLWVPETRSCGLTRRNVPSSGATVSRVLAGGAGTRSRGLSGPTRLHPGAPCLAFSAVSSPRSPVSPSALVGPRTSRSSCCVTTHSPAPPDRPTCGCPKYGRVR